MKVLVIDDKIAGDLAAAIARSRYDVEVIVSAIQNVFSAVRRDLSMYDALDKLDLREPPKFGPQHQKHWRKKDDPHRYHRGKWSK